MDEVAVVDETEDLSRPGMITFIAPGILPRPQTAIQQASLYKVVGADERSVAIFQPGDLVTIRENDTEETAVVASVSGNTLELETPLENEFTGGTIGKAALPRFGSPRDWLRARLKRAGAQPEVIVHGIYLNATWAGQQQTIDNEVLGSANGQPDQALFFIQAPVLPGEAIEVRELSGARAAVEFPILQEELRAAGLSDEDINIRFDPRSGQVSEVWVRWQERPHFYFSGPEDRHYVVERNIGRLVFGDGRNGRIPYPGAGNIRAARYRAGGGIAGNIVAQAITELLGVAPFVSEVTNPRAAEGGADSELLSAIKGRGPRTIRHRDRAVTASDFETLALQASPGVAIARARATTTYNDRPAAGWVTVIIVPQSLDPEPQPSYTLRRQVEKYLQDRAAVGLLPGSLRVIGPTYLPIGLTAYVAPVVIDNAGLIRQLVIDAATEFLHPLRGGPDGEGWPFGRDVYLSDIAAILESIPGVDYVEELSLMLDDTPQGETVHVPPDRIVVADNIRVEMKASETLGVA